MAGVAKFFLGILSGVALTVGSSAYYKQARSLPTGKNVEVAFAINSSLFRNLPASTYAANANSRSSYYPSRWQWRTYGGLYDEGQDFTLAMQTCGDRICSSYSLRSKILGIKRIKRKGALYKWAKGQRTIETSHANFVAQDFIYKEEDVIKWCTAFGSLPNAENPKYFYGWHCAPQTAKQNEAILDCVLESLNYDGRESPLNTDLGCTKERLVFSPMKPLKKKAKAASDIRS